jgi:hypothetical protein
MIKTILTVLLFACMLTMSSGGSELEEYHGTEIRVRYEVPLKEAARKLAAGYRSSRSYVEKKLGWTLQSVPDVVLLQSGDDFRRIVRNSLVTAYAVPARNLIVIDYSRMRRSPFDVEDTFRHELTHLLLHQNVAEAVLPKWLDEGVAQWASGGIADIMRTGERDLLQQAVLSHHMIDLRDISDTFPESSNGLILAYEESKSFVEFIVKNYGEEKLRSLLQRLEQRRTVDQAANEILGVPLDMLERQWGKSLARQNSWISYAADHLYWVIFFSSAVITIAGYCIARRRMKTYRDNEDDREEADSGGQVKDL